MQWPPLPPVDSPGTRFCERLSRLHGHSAAGRFKLMKNLNDPVGKRTSNVPACSAVPHPTACDN